MTGATLDEHTLRLALAILDRRANEHSEAAHEASAPAVAGREHNRATECWRAARAIAHELEGK